jgi:ATP adenylyltransferase/5',5'''-P-1,P-4-tetraphosphate phosphorylase II
MNYQSKTINLFREQKTNWPLLAANAEGLKNVRLKTFAYNGFHVNVQFNPKRITSSAAKVDKASIEARKCFLCAANRPDKQRSVAFENEYEILCNPFPIFPEHYTIAHNKHIPQEIKHSFADMLALSKALPNLVIFYNAPNCGASAPDHLHFQAGNTGFLPIEEEFDALKSKYGKTLINNTALLVTAINDGIRKMIVLEANDKEFLIKAFKPCYEFTSQLVQHEEPMLNILSWYNMGWRVIIFPREKHRPWQYFEEGEKNILLSPASVDFGGTLITPLEKDFTKISRDDISNIMQQLTLSDKNFEELTDYLKTTLK